MLRSTRVPWLFGPTEPTSIGAYESGITTWAPTWSIEIAACVKASLLVRRRWLAYLLDNPGERVALDTIRRLGGTPALTAYLKQTKDPAQ